MTVNKSQGRTLGIVGLDLGTTAFSYGQVYIEMSRVTDVDNLAILQVPPLSSTTTNIVYPELLIK